MSFYAPGVRRAYSTLYSVQMAGEKQLTLVWRQFCAVQNEVHS
jgi:hypothetical protein